MPPYRKLTSDLPDTPANWHYLPVIHHIQLEGRHYLRLTDHDGSVIRMTVSTPDVVDLLAPYLHLYELEQLDPWTHGPAFLPVEQTDDGWQFSAAGALYDRQVVTGSGTEDGAGVKPYRRSTFQ